MAGMENIEIPAAFFEQLGRSAGVEAAVAGIAEAGASAARASAPVDSGDYQRGIGVEVRRGRGRTVARIVASDPKSLIVEARTGNLQCAGRSVSR